MRLWNLIVEVLIDRLKRNDYATKIKKSKKAQSIYHTPKKTIVKIHLSHLKLSSDEILEDNPGVKTLASCDTSLH